MRRSPADSTNRSLAAFGKLQHIRRYSFLKVTSADYSLNSHFFWPDRISKTLVPVLKGNGTWHFPTGSVKVRLHFLDDFAEPAAGRAGSL